MKNTLLVVSIGIGLSACGGESSSFGVPSTSVPSSSPDLGAAIDATNSESDNSISVYRTLFHSTRHAQLMLILISSKPATNWRPYLSVPLLIRKVEHLV